MFPHNDITNTPIYEEILTEDRLETGRKTHTTKVVKSGLQRVA